MKILITTDLYATKTNGVVTSIRNLTEELQKKGHEIRILTVSETLKSHKSENVYYIKSLPLDVVYPDIRMPVYYHHRYIREMIEWEPDVIHSQCEYFSYHFASYISKKQVLLLSIPTIHSTNSMFPMSCQISSLVRI